MKKVSLLICLAMLAALAAPLAGAAAEDIDRTEKITLTYMYPLGDGFQVVDSMADNAAIKRANEERNVEIKFIHPPAGQETEQYNLMLVSDDLPDLITHGWGIPQLFPGGADKAIEDGYYIDLKDLIAKYAPNFQALMDTDENIRRVAMTDNGYVWGMCMVDRTPQPQWYGPAIRKDMFDKLGVDIPITIEDWYNALTAIKEKAPAVYPNFEVPLVVDKSGHGEFYSFLGSWDISDGFCLDENGGVIFGPATDAYLAYLTEMNKWYKEGLIANDYVTGYNRGDFITHDKTAALATSGFWEYDSWLATADDPDFALYGTPYPQLVAGSKPQVAYIPSRGHLGYHTVVTTSCKNPERTVDWMDWFYTDEGSQYANWGVEGEDFFYQDDGSKIFTDKIAHNEEGVAISVIYFKYLYSHGAFLREWDRENPSYGEEANACQWRWLGSTEYSRMIPSFLSYSIAESDRFTAIMNDINTYVGEMRVKFLTGELPLEDFGKFVDQMNAMNLQEAIAIESGAYTRYINR